MRESVAAILRCREEIFFIKRSAALRAFPGYSSFPGGTVERGESSNEALARELREEIDFDIQSHGAVLSVREYAWAKTPDFVSYRFKTIFYLISLKEKISFSLASTEIAEGQWAHPSSVLNSFNRGSILAVAPTISLLKSLTHEKKHKSILDVNFRYDEKKEVPVIEYVKGVVQLPVPSNTLPPANRTNAFLIGDSHAKKVLIDPSPRDDREFNRLLYTLRNRPIDEIFLTHHHGDHHQFAPDLARKQRIPISMSQDTRELIAKKWGEGYLEDIEIRVLREGNILTLSQGSPVTLLAVPGHDKGQIAPMVESRAWIIVGDLIQTVGTVVIGGEEGDMAQYFSSLQKVIDLNPQFIFPSHGMPLGGVAKIEKTLSHRAEREKQIKRLLSSGIGEKEMFDHIYKGLDPHLEKYARDTIRAHLKKIAEE